MATDKKPTSFEKPSISITGDVKDSVVIVGDNNKTFLQKVINYIFPSEKETLEHRNRRILLGHVENAWIKGVLDASLHGAALLDLGIKQDPEAVTKYPWAIKKESTNETLPAGSSMLEIFDSIGMGRSLLILGAPGSGKTTMLLELARQMIARAREDITQPIPMVFNLASWTEKLTLADWLVQELNNLYSVPRKSAPDWVKGDKLLLLLDGLDEVRQESRAKCVDAINAFRKQNGLTSLAVCSRSQDYADLNAKLSFEGAIEVQPLTQKQITEFFNRFGKQMTGIKQVLKKDNILREMAETPLFLSIMIMAYRDTQDVEIIISEDEKEKRKHLFNTYVERMFERSHFKNTTLKKQDALRWSIWLADKMVINNIVPFLLEDMQPTWFNKKDQIQYKKISNLFVGLIEFFSLSLPIFFIVNPYFGISNGLFYGLIGGLIAILDRLFKMIRFEENNIYFVDSLLWDWRHAKIGFNFGLKAGALAGIIGGMVLGLFRAPVIGLLKGITGGVLLGLLLGLIFSLISSLVIGAQHGISGKQKDQIKFPGQRLVFTARNILQIITFFGLLGAISTTFVFGLLTTPLLGLYSGLLFAIVIGVNTALNFGGISIIQHYTLRLILSRNNLLPWRLVPFLDHCVDLIFLRRVGGGYIFVHRLLMEHFAEMYVEIPTSKGN